MPREGIGRREYRERKFGGPEAVAEMDRRLTAVGAEEGIAFALDRIERTPNTFDAHRLAWHAQREGRQEAVVDALFRGYFTEGRDIGDRGTLSDLASEAGLDRGRVRDFLEGDEGAREIRAEEERVRRLGVQAVPFFILGGRYAVQGAQPPEVFVEAFDALAR